MCLQAKRAVFGSILEQREDVHKDGWNVATSQRRDVPTSRPPNVATSQRRDVESTYKEVNKRKRRDVNASYSSQSLKAKGGPEFKGGSEIEERTN